MFKKNDPLVESVKAVMEQNQLRRDVEAQLNEEIGIASKRALPHEYHAEYDALLEQRMKEELVGNQHKIDANKNNRVDAHDFKMLRAKKTMKEEEQLDELSKKSKKTLWSYAMAAKDEIARKRAEHGIPVDGSFPSKLEIKNGKDVTDWTNSRDLSPEAANIIRKRTAGLTLAAKRLTSEEVEQIDEKAVSKAQQRFFGLVNAIKEKKAHGSAKAEKAADEMSTKEVKKFAKTKQKGLPEKVDEDFDLEAVLEEIRANIGEEAFNELMNEQVPLPPQRPAEIGGRPTPPGSSTINTQRAPSAITQKPVNQADKVVGTDKAGYTSFNKKSETAASFRDMYAQARKAGSATFKWTDAKGTERSYATGAKGGKGEYSPPGAYKAGDATTTAPSGNMDIDRKTAGIQQGQSPAKAAEQNRNKNAATGQAVTPRDLGTAAATASNNNPADKRQMQTNPNPLPPSSRFSQQSIERERQEVSKKQEDKINDLNQRASQANRERQERANELSAQREGGIGSRLKSFFGGGSSQPQDQQKKRPPDTSGMSTGGGIMPEQHMRESLETTIKKVLKG